MPKNISVDFINKIITILPKKTKLKISAQELYSHLMNLFDDPENMKYDIPVVAKSKTELELVNGWQLNETSRKFLKGHISQG
jgi:hypothetical protein